MSHRADEGSRLGMGEERDSIEALAQSFALSPEFQCVTGWDGIVRRVNPAFTAAFGHTSRDLLGRQFAQLCHPEDRPAWQGHVAAAQAAGRSSTRFSCRVRDLGPGYRNATWYLAADPVRRLIFAFGRHAGPGAANG